MTKVYVHNSVTWVLSVSCAVSLLAVIGAIVLWDQPDRIPSLFYLALHVSLAPFFVNRLRCTVLTNRLLWDSEGGSAPVAQITELSSKGKNRWLVKWSTRLKRQATFRMSVDMAEQIQRRIGHVNLQDQTLAAPGFVPISWVPIFETWELTPIRNRPPTHFTVPITIAIVVVTALALSLKQVFLFLVVPLPAIAFAYFVPRVGRILTDGHLIEVNSNGVVRAIFIVGATIERLKSGLWEVKAQGESMTLFAGGLIAPKLLRKSTPSKKKAAQEQQGRCLLCGESVDQMADGTLAVCQFCQNRVQHEAELAGHGFR